MLPLFHTEKIKLGLESGSLPIEENMLVWVELDAHEAINQKPMMEISAACMTYTQLRKRI